MRVISDLIIACWLLYLKSKCQRQGNKIHLPEVSRKAKGFIEDEARRSKCQNINPDGICPCICHSKYSSRFNFKN